MQRKRISLKFISLIMLMTVFFLSRVTEVRADEKAASSDKALKLTYGLYTTLKPGVLHEQFKPLLNYLETSTSKDMGKPVKIQLRIFQSYDAGREAITTGQVDIMRLGPSSFVIAKKENPNIKLLAVEEDSGDRFAKGVIFTTTKTGIKAMKDIKGKSFAFGDPDSTSGRYVSQALLVDNGIFAKDLSKYDYLERHDKVCEAVVNGEYDVGTANIMSFELYKDRGLIPVETFEFVAKPWTVRDKLDPKITASLKKSLLALKDKEILKSLDKKLTGFFDAKDDVYEPVRIAMEKSQKFGGEPKQAKK